MAGKKIITVFGATGLQGGAVAYTFLHDSKLKSQWTVRAVTRDSKKENAKKLASQGAEVVEADMNDTLALVDVMAGASAVFAVTNYWEKVNMQLEIMQGKNMVDAAQEAGVDHFIFSSLLNITKLTNGKLPHVYHFDGKAEIEEYARESGIPATFFLPGFYMTGVPGAMLRAFPPNDTWVLSMPCSDSAPIPVFSPLDTGKFVKGIVLNRDSLLGKRVLGATTYTTPAELLDQFKKMFPKVGETAAFYQVGDEQYKEILKNLGLPDYAAVELLENMKLFEVAGYFGGEKLDESHAIVEDKLTTWEEVMKASPVLKDLK